MLIIEIVSREDLSFVIERDYCEDHDCTLSELLLCRVKNFDINKNLNLSVYVDGVKIPKQNWCLVKLTQAKSLKFVLEPGTFAEVAAIISLVLAVATTIYSIYMMNKMQKSNGTQAAGNSIYDVNAQGNKVSLQQVVPENFGYFKRFPDYIADVHSYYSKNKKIQDILLCQGVGYYLYDSQHEDMFIGSTSIANLSGTVKVDIFDPGVDISKNSKIDPNIYYCWFNSTEVTSSGHTIGSATLSTAGKKVSLQYKSFCVGDYCDDMGWEVGDFVTFSGCGAMIEFLPTPSYYKNNTYYYSAFPNNTRNGWTSQQQIRTVVDETGNEYVSKIYVNGGGCSGSSSFGILYAYSYQSPKILINPDINSAYGLYNKIINPFTSSWQNLFIDQNSTYPYRVVPMGISLCSLYSYFDVWGAYTQKAGSVVNYLPTNATNGRRYFSGYDYVVFDVSGTKKAPPTEPAYPINADPSKPIKKDYGVVLNVLSTNSLWTMYTEHGIEDDNGTYKITEILTCPCSRTDGTEYTAYFYMVARVDEDYKEYEDWQCFWNSGYMTDAITIELSAQSYEDKGSEVGPYRAAPIGATCRYVELDFNAPAGICHIDDNGNYEPSNVQIEISYQKVGDLTWKTSNKTIQGRNQDELGRTFSFDCGSLGNWIFKVKRITPTHTNDTKYVDTVKWVGLKSRLEESPKSYADMTTLALRVTGSETLSEMSSNQISTLWVRKLPDIYTSELEPTSNIAPVVNYVMSKSKYNGILGLDNLKEFDEFWGGRELQFNGSFDDDNTLFDALKSILQVGFSVPVVDGNVLKCSRQEVKDVKNDISQLLCDENMTDFEYLFTPTRADDVKEICIKYTDPDTYKSANVYVMADSSYYTVTNSNYPRTNNFETLDGFGITSYKQALSLASRRALYLALTKESYTIRCELLGMTMNFNNFVGIVSALDKGTTYGAEESEENARIIGYNKENTTRLEFYTDKPMKSSAQSGNVHNFYVIDKYGTPHYIEKYLSSSGDYKTHYLPNGTTWLDLELGEWEEGYGTSIDFPIISSTEWLVKPAWVTSIDCDSSSSTIKLVNYDSRMFNYDPKISAGFGLSEYGTSPFGQSY